MRMHGRLGICAPSPVPNPTPASAPPHSYSNASTLERIHSRTHPLSNASTLERIHSRTHPLSNASTLERIHSRTHPLHSDYAPPRGGASIPAGSNAAARRLLIQCRMRPTVRVRHEQSEGDKRVARRRAGRRRGLEEEGGWTHV
ncbi:hypothetical protein WOLCODRAFT_166009 [Wolfiporia cocos MD-104 SS10]|uniref:Uncharacterized protein n=1 Tax=Wolfiporia cocos (strain MD-104) TaxID=742152 RepID=A0A2H3JBM5_WOLCO|nr:hypothetical protein WOLCODRAFT_166009 [Wolfiporia cocos MD-104 SS10]